MSVKNRRDPKSSKSYNKATSVEEYKITNFSIVIILIQTCNLTSYLNLLFPIGRKLGTQDLKSDTLV